MADFISSKTVTTRKKHNCFGCGRVFDAGTKMQTNTSADMGQISTAHICDTCNAIMSEFPEEVYANDDDYTFAPNFVDDVRNHGESPEDLLIRLRKEKTK